MIGKVRDFVKMLLPECKDIDAYRKKEIYFLFDNNVFVFFFCSEEAIRQSGNPTTKTASEMETHFFQRANNKVNILICHKCESLNCKT
jgi:hypothetical protein